MEIWEPISGYENYLVSNKGNVKSLNYNHTNKEKLLVINKYKSGYAYVNLYNEMGAKKKKVHKLVFEAFNKDFILGDLEINHIDECKDNNNIYNLEAVSKKENANHGTRNLRISEKNKGKKSRYDNCNFKNMEYYSTKPSFRYNFKNTCKIAGWKFEDFEEIFHSYHKRPNGAMRSKYIYKIKKN